MSNLAGPYEPMEVTRKRDGARSYVEPELDRTWSDLDQLRWLTGVVEADHGLRINITTGGYTSNGRPVPDSYGVSFRGHSMGPIVGFHAAWRAISHLGIGFSEGRRAQHTQEARNRTQTALQHTALADIAEAAHNLSQAICDWLDLKENQ